jgi:hypothetical protein
MPDKYEIRTHYMPALLCSAPFMALGIYFIAQLDDRFWDSVLTQAFGGVTMSFALYFLAAFTCRHVGKWLEDRVFGQGKDFPTTKFLLDSDTNLSHERKQEIYAKIKTEFNIDLAGKTDGGSAGRKRIHEAIGQIRQRFFKKNEMILQRNIQFGFAKNVTGGAIVAVITSLLLCVLSVLSGQHQVLKVSVLLLCAYILLGLYGLAAMKSNAGRYAHTLFDEFLAN